MHRVAFALAFVASIGSGEEQRKSTDVEHLELKFSTKALAGVPNSRSMKPIAELLLSLHPAAGFQSSASQALPARLRRCKVGQNAHMLRAPRHGASVDMTASDEKGLSPSFSPQVDRRSLLIGAGVAGSLLASLPASAADEGLFNPSPGSLDGTTIFITGANTGLGLESAKRLAKAGASIIVSARSKAKVDETVKEVADSAAGGKVFGVELDLADLSDVKSLPKRLEAAVGGSPVIDVLLNNAGVMAIPERLTTTDGFEKTVGINHLGHFALTSVLLPTLRKAKNGFRIVTVASEAHKISDKNALATSIDAKLDPPGYGLGGWPAYGVSKAANILFTVELQRRLEAAGVKGSAVALHPGVVQTDLARYIIGGVKYEDVRPTQIAEKPTGIGKFFKENLLDKAVIPVPIGANTQVYLAAAADTGGDLTRSGGLYFDKMKPDKATEASTDGELAKKLWAVSEQLTGTKIDF
mmetsp:Transcript_64800/g.122905  ORF Transcript_64800/g.122905 Transcript_64800/m.122905 type:complete len:469 (+) Transcript_64800:92-1498(+)